jgi:hypothetical protein
MAKTTDKITNLPLKKSELDEAANRGAETKPRPERLGGDFRSRIDGTQAGDLNQDPRAPYPWGSPPDPEEIRRRTHGGD